MIEFKTLGLDFKVEFSKDIKFNIINENLSRFCKQRL